MQNHKYKALAIVAAALAAAAGIACLAIFWMVPQLRYHKAQSLIEQGDRPGAYDLLDRLGDFRDADQLRSKLQSEALASRSDETIRFGGYDWLVLETRDGSSLLLLQTALAPRPFHDALTETSWESCTLRAYLNGEFFDSLPAADRARIAETQILNSANLDTKAKEAAPTRDHIFLLSYAEAKFYFPTNAARAARYDDGSAAWWWLRSPGVEGITAAIVSSDGSLGFAGSGVNAANRGVRPAVWVVL